MNRYAEERGLILEVNTYMFPPIRRDPSMVGRNERFTPEEAAQYHMKRYRIQYGVERYKSFLENVVKRILPPAEVGRSLRWHSLRRCRLLAIHTSN